VEYHLTVIAKFGILGHTLMLGTVEMLPSECLCVRLKHLHETCLRKKGAHGVELRSNQFYWK
jgi:hypothetical protein